MRDSKKSPFKKATQKTHSVRPEAKRGSKSADAKRGAKPGFRTVKPQAKAELVLQGFLKIWENLFSTPVHLDSALSKQAPSIKSILAQILPSILLRPASQAEALGIGISSGDPWRLDSESLAHWRPSQIMAERLYAMMAQPNLNIDPIEEDFPPHMIAEWGSSWGKSCQAELIDVLGREAPLGIRASRRVGASPLLAKLTSQEKLPVRIELSDLSPLGIRLAGYAPILGTEWYQKGDFEIQDEGSQLMALFALWPERYAAILKDRPGKIKKLGSPPPPLPKDTPPWVVVDACAGAGGKSLAFADILKGKGRVYSYDTSEKKLMALRRRATRAGVNNIQTVALQEGNEAATIEQFKATANVVLVDAPCTGWGVLRRNPDTKWRQSEEVLNRLPLVQARLLSLYSQLVAPGGRLVYGVCTFRLAETRDIARAFSAENPDFTLQEGGYLGPGPCDGFFMQSWVRKG